MVWDKKREIFDKLGYKPHAKQELVHKSEARFRTLCSGRRFGKSLLASREAIFYVMIPDSRGWIVAPNYELAKKVFREIFVLMHKHFSFLIKSSSEHNQQIVLRNGSEIVGKSADNPVSLLGEGLNFLIIDEAASIKQEVWEEYLRPTLSDRGGWALFISTPKGKNWFYEEFVRGQDPLIKDFESWNFLTSDNPYIPKDEISHAKRFLPERVFLQEFQGVFLEDIGGVFRNVRECIKGRLEEPIINESYVFGIDLAKHQDFTVLCCFNRGNNHLVFFDRFHQLDWGFQKSRIVVEVKKYNNAEVILDATGIGDPIYDDLLRAGLNVKAFKISGTTKRQLIENLSLMIQEKEMSYPEIPELINELNIYEYQTSPTTGHTRYNAPEGYHDDIVIALALGGWGLKDNTFEFGFLEV